MSVYAKLFLIILNKNKMVAYLVALKMQFGNAL